MPTQPRMKRNHRQITRRIVINGVLILTTPTCLGNGDAEGLTDIALLRDSISDHALLTGASMAGALRNYLREYQNNYGQPESQQDWATLLFGGIRSDDEGDQSPLIVYDTFSSQPPDIELRDGVRIDSASGTAQQNAKYDLEFLAAGTEFPLQFELLIDASCRKDDLIQALAIALQGLEQGQIHIGMKKRRGFGHCHVETWKVWDFNMQDAPDRMAWLTFNTSWGQKKQPIVNTIQQALNLNELPTDQRQRLFLEATFKLEGSLLIRSGQAETGKAPDVVHLKSQRNGEPKPVLSGTSLAGVLRHRAERIVLTLGGSSEFVDNIFGVVEKEKKPEKPNRTASSRLIVAESVIQETADLVQTRIAIDRFTGGTLNGALFDEQPIFGGDQSQVTVSLELCQPQEAEIGLLLLLLKDLWTSDLPVGGGSSIGRGRLKGKSATITRKSTSETKTWTIEQIGETLKVSHAVDLQSFVDELVNQVGRKAS